MAYQTISNLANISPVTRINGNTCTFTAELTEASFFPGAIIIITFDSKTLALDTIKLKGKGSRSNRDELLGYAEGLFTEWRSQVDYAHEEALEDNTVWDIENNCTCDESVESSYFQEYGCCEFCFHQEANEIADIPPLKLNSSDTFVTRIPKPSQTSQEAAHDTLYLVDLQDPSEPEESDLEAAKEFLMNIWMESEGVEDILEKVSNCMTVQELNNMLHGIDYELMTKEEVNDLKATLYAEKHGIIEYDLKGELMTYEDHGYKWTYNVRTRDARGTLMAQKRTTLTIPKYVAKTLRNAYERLNVKYPVYGLVRRNGRFILS
jgi:hypothetical protein